MHKNFISKYGLFLSTFFVTILSIILSIFITYLIMFLTGDEFVFLSLMISIIAPATIAPSVVIVYGKLLMKITDLEKEMRLLATNDQLTGVLSRYGIFQSAQLLLNNAERKKENVSIIYCDLDYFKKINDTYGHEIGDFVLKESGSRFIQNRRKGDLVGRIGGEEFLIVLPDTNNDEALVIAEKIKKIFSEKTFDTNDNSIKTTISMGISDCFEAGTYELDDLMCLADECLYLSKENGRNKVTVYKSLEIK